MANQKMSEALRTPGKILYNRFVMYFILVLAIADLLFLAVGGELMLVAIFLLIGFVTSFFSKNMVVIMTISMAIVNIIRFGTGQKFEGLENEDEDAKKKKEEEAKKKEEDAKKKSDEEKKKKEEEETKKKEEEKEKEKNKTGEGEVEREREREKEKKTDGMSNKEKFTSVSEADKIQFANSVQRIMNGIQELGR